MSTDLVITKIGKVTVVEFNLNSMMDPSQIESIQQRLFRLVDEEDCRLLVLDFDKVVYISSAAIGIVMGLQTRLRKLPNSKLLLCSVSPKIMELLKITRLDRILTLKPSQKEAINSLTL